MKNKNILLIFLSISLSLSAGEIQGRKDFCKLYENDYKSFIQKAMDDATNCLENSLVAECAKKHNIFYSLQTNYKKDCVKLRKPEEEKLCEKYADAKNKEKIEELFFNNFTRVFFEKRKEFLNEELFCSFENDTPILKLNEGLYKAEYDYVGKSTIFGGNMILQFTAGPREVYDKYSYGRVEIFVVHKNVSGKEMNNFQDVSIKDAEAVFFEITWPFMY